MLRRHCFYLFSAAMFVIATASVCAQVPRVISFQGVLANAAGELVADGNHVLTLSLYGDFADVTPIFTEQQTVPVVRGVFNALIGSITVGGVPVSLSFEKAYYLGVSVNADAELIPRTPLTTVPYAFRAAVADAMAPGAKGVVTSVNGLDGTVMISGSGGTSVTQDEFKITISSSGGTGTGIQSVQGVDGTIDVVNPTGPTATISLATNAVTTSKIADGAVTSAKLSSTGASSGQAIIYNGSSIAWGTPASTLVLPFTANVANASALFSITNAGTGRAGYFQIDNATSTSSALVAETNGARFGTSGPAGIHGKHTGNGGCAVYGEATGARHTAGTEPCGVRGQAVNGHGVLGRTTSGVGVVGSSDGAGKSVYGQNLGTGEAGYFLLFNTLTGAPAIYGESNGIGTVVKFNHTGATGPIAMFQTAGLNVSRIDRVGKGFFNGGTQTGGADVAEAFEVEGDRASYEPGDVLVISLTRDRTVTMSGDARSTRVAGVVASKPGVLLSERSIEESHDDLVPMGVVGVIPTKVSIEGGTIARGDLLVTSSTRGHAMKASNDPAIGTVIGKALEPFDGDTGLIRVLVTVR